MRLVLLKGVLRWFWRFFEFCVGVIRWQGRSLMRSCWRMIITMRIVPDVRWISVKQCSAVGLLENFFLFGWSFFLQVKATVCSYCSWKCWMSSTGLILPSLQRCQYRLSIRFFISWYAILYSTVSTHNSVHNKRSCLMYMCCR